MLTTIKRRITSYFFELGESTVGTLQTEGYSERGVIVTMARTLRGLQNETLDWGDVYRAQPLGII